MTAKVAEYMGSSFSDEPGKAALLLAIGDMIEIAASSRKDLDEKTVRRIVRQEVDAALDRVVDRVSFLDAGVRKLNGVVGEWIAAAGRKRGWLWQSRI